jgi:hypothetical protein
VFDVEDIDRTGVDESLIWIRFFALASLALGSEAGVEAGAVRRLRGVFGVFGVLGGVGIPSHPSLESSTSLCRYSVTNACTSPCTQ